MVLTAIPTLTLGIKHNDQAVEGHQIRKKMFFMLLAILHQITNKTKKVDHVPALNVPDGFDERPSLQCSIVSLVVSGPSVKVYLTYLLRDP